jgi:inorganic triphosphatase YgiF
MSKAKLMTEIESTLIVISSKPYEALKRVAELDSISMYVLVPQKTQAIRDTYFDRRDRALESSKLGLRIRKVDKEWLVTLKGSPKINSAGVSERDELELGWSEEGVRRVIEELARWGIETEDLPRGIEMDRPLAVMSELGLEVIQEREDSRQVRNLFPEGEPSNLLAELAIDSVTFKFKGQQVHHREVEIEAKSGDGAQIIGSLTKVLGHMFPLDLTVWVHGKLATGRAVMEMADAGELNALLDERGNLKPEAYSRIEAYIRARDNSVL